MTMKKVHKMSEGQRLLFIWLSLCEILLGSFRFVQSLHTEYTKAELDYILDTQYFPEDSFAYAYFDDIPDSPGDDYASAIVMETGGIYGCALDCRTERILSCDGVSSLKRFNISTGLLTAYDETMTGDKSFKHLHFNLEACRFTPLDLPEKHIILVTYRNSEEFDVLVSDRHACQSANAKCRFNYHGLNRRSVQPFDIDLDWKSLQVEYARPSRAFLIRGLDNDAAYKFVLLDRSSAIRKELLSIPNATNMEFMSSQFMICWIKNPGVDKTIYCSQINEHAQIVFHRVETYPVAVSLVSLQHLSANKTLLLTRPANCKAAPDKTSCWDFAFTLLQPIVHEKFTQHPLHFNCTVPDKPFVFSAEQSSVGVTARLLCENGRHFMHESNIIIPSNEL